MKLARVWPWIAAALAAGCGSRTGLELPLAAGEAPVDAGCSQGLPPWLLFDTLGGPDSGPSGIYAMRIDGSAGHMVTLPHGPALFPSVSRDGTKLLYATFLDEDGGTDIPDGGDDSALYLYDFASGTASLVVTTSQLTYSALSPDGKTVAYTTGYSLHAIAPDGTNDRALLVGPDCGYGFGHPTFAADSSTILYGAGGMVGAIGIDGSGNETLLSAIPGSFQYPNPAFSPDYQRIVVGAFCDQDSPDALRIYPYASLPGATCESGQLLVDVSEGSSPNSANDPSWGPTGLIAYASGQDVYVIDPSGGLPRDMTAELTGDGGTITASDPVWAPGCAAMP